LGDAAGVAVGFAPGTARGVRRVIPHFQPINGSLLDRVTHTLAHGVDPPNHTVLVVDDDASIRFLCRINLELEGWDVREARTIDQARSMLAEGGIEVVLLDVHVGSDSGVDFLAELRADYVGLPVAMLTGSFGSPTVDGVVTDGVIPKPFTLEQLIGTVRELTPRPAHRAG
jgi:DNA-binding NtrC family response regulator